jgi:hypothetical protein
VRGYAGEVVSLSSMLPPPLHTVWLAVYKRRVSAVCSVSLSLGSGDWPSDVWLTADDVGTAVVRRTRSTLYPYVSLSLDALSLSKIHSPPDPHADEASEPAVAAG